MSAWRVERGSACSKKSERRPCAGAPAGRSGRRGTERGAPAVLYRGAASRRPPRETWRTWRLRARSSVTQRPRGCAPRSAPDAAASTAATGHEDPPVVGDGLCAGRDGCVAGSNRCRGWRRRRPELGHPRSSRSRPLLSSAVVLCVATTVLLGALPSRLAWRLGLAGTLRQVDARAGGSADGRTRALLVDRRANRVRGGPSHRRRADDADVRQPERGGSWISRRAGADAAHRAPGAALRRPGAAIGVLHRRARSCSGSTWGHQRRIHDRLPLVFPGGGFLIEAEGRPPPQNAVANMRLVTPGYLPAMGTTLLAGRLLDDGDREGGEAAAVINQTMAERFWPGEDPLDLRFRSCATCPWTRVVGLVKDLHQEALSAEVRPECYAPFYLGAQSVPFMQPKDLAVRTAADPMALLASVRAAIWSVDPAQPIAQVRVMADYVDDDLARTVCKRNSPERSPRSLCCSRRWASTACCRTRWPSGVTRWACVWRWAPSAATWCAGWWRAGFDRCRRRRARPRRRVRAGSPDRRPALRRASARSDDVRCGRRDADRGRRVACWLPARRASRVDPLAALRAE